VQSSTLSITAGKDSVVRSNPFTVVISDQPQNVYTVQIEDPSTSDVNPSLTVDQVGYLKDSSISVNDQMGRHVIGGQFKTDASGKRTVQFETTAETTDKTYTIRVNGSGVGDYDKVKIRVEKGSITFSASGDGSYYLGEEVKLTGTNTDSGEVWLFVTGPNLMGTDGVILKQLPIQTEAYHAGPSDKISVKTDGTWEYKWDTSRIGLDTGAYTIYATSVMTNGKSSSDREGAVKLSDSEYATVSVTLKQPFLSAIPSGAIVAKGDKIYIRGIAEGAPSCLQLYIFGPNKYVTESITVEDDGSYAKKLEIDSNWASNQYFVVIEHPMYNNVIDVDENYYDKNGHPVCSKNSAAYAYTALEIKNFSYAYDSDLQSSFVVEGINKLQGSNAANALTQMIDSANIDDIYTKLTFTVAEPWIKINNPGDQTIGSKFTITGATNLVADDQILIEIVSSSFNAVDKSSTSATSGVSQTTKIVAGEGGNGTWSVDVDTTNWKLDEYTIKAGGIEVDVTSTANFNLTVGSGAKTPTQSSHETSAVAPVAPKTSTPLETPATPGFGAFVALAGLGAVALLVLRRN
jgi:PGF-CTERM protein